MKYFYNLKIRVDKIDNLREIIIKKLNIKDNVLLDFKINKRSIDAREKEIFYNLKLILTLKHKINNKNLIDYQEDKSYKFSNEKYYDTDRPIIIGFGPAGMFSALILALSGAKPIVVERGSKVEDRKKKIENFNENSILDPESNVVFGEGGAGTFSDGKLQSNIKNEYNNFVLKMFNEFGAGEDILIDSLPHIGTDVLEIVCKNFREYLISLGTTFYFDTKFINFKNKDNSVICCFKNKETEFNLETKHLILGIGHSAKDTYKMLYENGVALEPKAFSMGVRIEHKQDMINTVQYKEYKKYLKAAPYKLACHLTDRSVYTFCMCPGGYVVSSQNEEKTIVTNGMSYSDRAGINANSALLCEVKVSDFYKNSPLDGLYFQEKYEKLAYSINKSYLAPINLVKEFLEDELATDLRSIKPTIKPGYKFSDLSKCLPDFVCESLKEAIKLLDKKLPGFNDPDAVLTAIESRSSSPVRILRENYKTNINYIYAIGEGAGYAGGIMTSAIDGLKCGLSILNEQK